MTGHRNQADHRAEPAGSLLPGWWLVASQELTDLWMGGKAFVFLILFSILLGVMSFLLATDIELKIIPPEDMVFLTMQITIAVGLFVGLIIAADSISGERERATLEGLLLTPTSRRQIVVGKFLAAVSPWPAVLAVASPYLALLSPDAAYFTRVLLWGGLAGSILVAAFTGFALFVSIRSSSNMTSLSISLFIYLLLLLPTQLPGTGAVGRFLQEANPVEASNQFLLKVLVNNRAPGEMSTWLAAPVLFAGLVLGLLFLYAGPRLRLDVEKARTAGSYVSAGASALLTVCLLALVGTPTKAALPAATATPESGLQIDLDIDHKVVKTGDKFVFNTLVTYTGMAPSAPMVVAMNIVNLNKNGNVVDPEDWSPRRTQSIEPVTPDQSVALTWTVHAILDGDYMVYMVVIPQPEGTEVSSQPVAGSGLHLTVTPYARINPGGVLPLAIGMPIGLTLCMSVLRWLRRRGVDKDDAGKFAGKSTAN
jgi:ABC-2 type transport system permease protein